MNAHDWEAAGVALFVLLVVAGILWACQQEDRRLSKPLPHRAGAENSATARDSSRGRVLIPYLTIAHDTGRPELWLGYMDDARTFVPVAGPEPVPRHWQALQRWENRP